MAICLIAAIYENIGLMQRMVWLGVVKEGMGGEAREVC